MLRSEEFKWCFLRLFCVQTQCHGRRHPTLGSPDLSLAAPLLPGLMVEAPHGGRYNSTVTCP